MSKSTSTTQAKICFMSSRTAGERKFFFISFFLCHNSSSHVTHGGLLSRLACDTSNMKFQFMALFFSQISLERDSRSVCASFVRVK